MTKEEREQYLKDHLITASDLIAQGVEEDKEWETKVYIRYGFLTLNIEYEYDIELDRINTEGKLLKWMVHLLEKNWMTTEVLSRMVRVWEKRFGKLNLNC